LATVWLRIVSSCAARVCEAVLSFSKSERSCAAFWPTAVGPNLLVVAGSGAVSTGLSATVWGAGAAAYEDWNILSPPAHPLNPSTKAAIANCFGHARLFLFAAPRSLETVRLKL
jgi:hypothetical protein